MKWRWICWSFVPASKCFRPTSTCCSTPIWRRSGLAESRQRFMRTLAVLEEARTRGELPPYLERPLADLLGLVREAQQALAGP